MASVARAISALMVMVNFTLLVSRKRSSQARNSHTPGESGSEDDSAQAVDEHVGQIVVGGIHAADETLRKVKLSAAKSLDSTRRTLGLTS